MFLKVSKLLIIRTKWLPLLIFIFEGLLQCCYLAETFNGFVRMKHPLFLVCTQTTLLHDFQCHHAGLGSCLVRPLKPSAPYFESLIFLRFFFPYKRNKIVFSVFDSYHSPWGIPVSYTLTSFTFSCRQQALLPYTSRSHQGVQLSST